jgi:hypothetical protein
VWVSEANAARRFDLPGPVAGVVILSLSNDVVTRKPSITGSSLGVMILVFVLGLRKGLNEFVIEKLRGLCTGPARASPNQ